MHKQPSVDAVALRAPAKVNLFLEVLSKRPDGYHEIATLMVAVGLYDRLVFTADVTGQIVLRCNRPGLTTGPDNLVCRAAELLKQRTGCGHGVRIDLDKRIPMAAGLAGGSSDAAATLEGLNRLWQLRLARQELAALAAELGSDVAFFFSGPAAWCTGRGEVVTPVQLGRPLDLVLVCPEGGISTAAVYKACSVPAQPEVGDAIRQAAEAGNTEEIGRRLHNRLQPVAERLCPEVAELHARLVALKPAGQLMSGSGSSLFALCRDRREAVRIVRALRAEEGGRKLYLVRSCVS